MPIPIPMSMSIQIATSMVMCMPMQNKIASPRADKRPGGMCEAIRINRFSMMFIGLQDET